MERACEPVWSCGLPSSQQLAHILTGISICRLLNANHAAIRRVQQAPGGPGGAARLLTAASEACVRGCRSLGPRFSVDHAGSGGDRSRRPSIRRRMSANNHHPARLGPTLGSGAKETMGFFGGRPTGRVSKGLIRSLQHLVGRKRIAGCHSSALWTWPARHGSRFSELSLSRTMLSAGAPSKVDCQDGMFTSGEHDLLCWLPQKRDRRRARGHGGIAECHCAISSAGGRSRGTARCCLEARCPGARGP